MFAAIGRNRLPFLFETEVMGALPHFQFFHPRTERAAVPRKALSGEVAHEE
jgi:hypothetical protein